MASGTSSETKLIKLIAERLSVRGENIKQWIGDDAAVVSNGGQTVTTIDAFVEAVHFSRDWPMSAIGYKAIVATVSDIAAMGAMPGEAYIALGVDTKMKDSDIDELYSGIEEAAKSCNLTVCGGDLTRSGTLFIVVTVNGWAQKKEQLVTRTGAKPGDLVCVTGCLGGAGAGLKLLGGIGAELSPEVCSELKGRQQYPQPNVELGLALASAGATSMIDISDGLATDARHLAEESAVTVTIELDKVPLQEGVTEVAAAAGEDPSEFAARSGEDYELLATVPLEKKAATERAVEEAGSQLTFIGSVVSDKGRLRLIGSDSTEVRLNGFDHFST